MTEMDWIITGAVAYWLYGMTLIWRLRREYERGRV